MNHQVQVFEVGRDAKPDERPRATTSFAVSAETLEDARRAAVKRLESDGRTVRSISFLAGGGLAAVVTDPAPAPSAAQLARATGGR